MTHSVKPLGSMLSAAQWRAGWPIWFWLAVTALLLLWPDALEQLRYQRNDVGNGAWWRLFSANLVHSNGWHWLLNAASASFQFWLFQGLGSKRSWWIVSLLCAVGNVLGMHWFSPGVGWYVGMSGALYGTAVIGGLLLLANREWLVGGVLSAYLLGRILYEQLGGHTQELASLIEAPVAVDAHLWGLVCGYLLALPLIVWQRRQARALPAQ
jgi:rhomboid family GlyGly-CTERM serine protease